jgi:hypothetical protein
MEQVIKALRPAKAVARRFQRGLRTLTADRRADPKFLIIGAQKAGTTFLHSLLVQHPSVIAPMQKEVHYFDLNFERPLQWYKAHFPAQSEITRREDKLGARVVTGESTPYYIFHPMVAERVHSVYPRIRLIVVLRDPVSRAISHYAHSVRYGYERLPIVEAFEREAERLAGEEDRLRRIPGYRSFGHQHHSYLSRGLYMDQLERWTRFFPPDRFLLLHSAELFSRTEEALDRVCDFLGLPRHRFPSEGNRNAGWKPEVPAELRGRLEAWFDEPNRRLLARTGIRF